MIQMGMAPRQVAAESARGFRFSAGACLGMGMAFTRAAAFPPFGALGHSGLLLGLGLTVLEGHRAVPGRVGQRPVEAAVHHPGKGGFVRLEELTLVIRVVVLVRIVERRLHRTNFGALLGVPLHVLEVLAVLLDVVSVFRTLPDELYFVVFPTAIDPRRNVDKLGVELLLVDAFRDFKSIEVRPKSDAGSPSQLVLALLLEQAGRLLQLDLGVELEALPPVEEQLARVVLLAGLPRLGVGLQILQEAVLDLVD